MLLMWHCDGIDFPKELLRWMYAQLLYTLFVAVYYNISKSARCAETASGIISFSSG